MNRQLSAKSIAQLQNVHPDLIAVVKRAIVISKIDFVVLEGVRSQARQKQLYVAKATKTMNSRHLTGHAIDLGAYVGGTIRWDWPLYRQIASAMKTAAAELKIPLTWGGDWKTFPDGPHFELPWSQYPWF